MPAFVLTDQYLADSQWTFEGFDIKKLKYTDYRLRGDNFRSWPHIKDMPLLIQPCRRLVYRVMQGMW